MCGRAQQQQTIDALQTSVDNQQHLAEQQKRVIEDLTQLRNSLQTRVEDVETEHRNLLDKLCNLSAQFDDLRTSCQQKKSKSSNLCLMQYVT